VSELDEILRGLLAETRASRVTLRLVAADGDFPVAEEALAPGVASLKDERTVDLRTQPVALEVRRRGQVVQDDSRSAYDDPAYQHMLEAFGGLAAQIVTAVVAEGAVAGIVSVHQLATARGWTEAEARACRRAAARIAELL
jgi:GAF domain-containing protein